MTDTIVDGNTYLIGYWVDNLIKFIGELFSGLGVMAYAIGLILGIFLIIFLLSVLWGKIMNAFGNVTGGFVEGERRYGGRYG